MIRTEEGDVVKIDRILDVRQAPALKVGGQGVRYTCQIPQQSADDAPGAEREIYLFYDRNQWFIEE